jgi:glycosyltransferase involved in cell wall biosynthesis
MRILLASDFYPPHVGGMEQHVRGLACQLQVQGHDVFVVTTDRDDRRETLDDIEVERLSGSAQRLSFAFSNENRRYPPPIVDPELVLKLGRVLDRIQPDVVHMHGWIAYSMIVANARRRHPLVLTLHDYGQFCPKRTLLSNDANCDTGRGYQCLKCASAEYGLVKSLVCYTGTGMGIQQLQAVDAFVAVSSYVKERNAPYLPGKPVHVVPNFLSPVAFAAERDHAARSVLPDKYLLFVGVLAAFKGVDDLIEAYLIARERSATTAKTQLILAGRTHPSRRYESDPANGIHILYDPPRGLVVEAIASCQCLVVPSRCADACPTVVLEGICAGRPVIGTGVGGIPELLQDVRGTYIVPVGNPMALAAALGEICDSFSGSLDVELPACPLNYLPLQPDRVAQAIVDVYAMAAQRRANQVYHGL